MVAIGRRSLLALVSTCLLEGDDPQHDALRAINRLTTALSDGDAGGAIAAFDKSCPGYETLSSYFAALTSSFAVTNDADVVDEKESGDTSSLTLDWTLTLQSLASGATIRKEQQVSAEVARKQLKITRFSPVDFFYPAESQAGAGPATHPPAP